MLNFRGDVTVVVVDTKTPLLWYAGPSLVWTWCSCCYLGPNHSSDGTASFYGVARCSGVPSHVLPSSWNHDSTRPALEWLGAEGAGALGFDAAQPVLGHRLDVLPLSPRKARHACASSVQAVIRVLLLLPIHRLRHPEKSFFKYVTTNVFFFCFGEIELNVFEILTPKNLFLIINIMIFWGVGWPNPYSGWNANTAHHIVWMLSAFSSVVGVDEISFRSQRKFSYFCYKKKNTFGEKVSQK